MDADNGNNSKPRLLWHEKEASPHNPSPEVDVSALEEEPEFADPSDTFMEGLEKLLFFNLHALYKTAIGRLMEFGYSEEVAENSLCSCGFYGRVHTTIVENVVGYSLALLKKSSGCNPERDPAIKDLHQLVDYTMLEIINVLTKVNPSLSLAEAIWSLLVCDLNIFEACTLNGGETSIVAGKDVSSTNPHSSQAEGPKSMDPANAPVCGRMRLLREALMGSVLSAGNSESDQNVRSKKNSFALPLVKKYKAYLREPMLQAPSHSAPLRKKETGDAAASLATKSPSKAALPAKSKTNTSVSGYYAGLPFDESLGKFVPRDEKDEQILKLAPRLEQLQSEINGWSKWANTKVMQVAHRLTKEQPELKKLRQGKEEEEDLKQKLAEKISEMELDLEGAYDRVERATYTVSMLQREGAELRQQMEDAEKEAEESAVSCREELQREQKLLQKAKIWPRQKEMLLEELQSERSRVADLQLHIDKERNHLVQLEARYLQEKEVEEKLLVQADTQRREREKLQADVEEEARALKGKSEAVAEDAAKLRSKITLLRLQEDFVRLSPLRRSNGTSFGGFMTAGSSSSYCTSLEKQLRFMKASARGGLKLERECVMCLSKEKSVIFLPCAHQVVCRECNEMHERQGMTECPSCRTHVERRIQARFARG